MKHDKNDRKELQLLPVSQDDILSDDKNNPFRSMSLNELLAMLEIIVETENAAFHDPESLEYSSHIKYLH